MKLLFLHGWQSVPGGVKPMFLAQHGYEVINSKLPDEDFEEAISIAQEEFDKHQPQVIVGSSRGGAVAITINSGEANLVLLCPAWKKFGTVRTAKPGTVILHSRADDVVPFADSEELVKKSGLPVSALIEVGNDHRLADLEPPEAMLEACEREEENNSAHKDVTTERLNMTYTDAYQNDLAYIHDTGFGRFARGSSPGLLNLLLKNSITDGLVVDLGCGSGIWARELADHGYDVVGVDISPAMIELARQRVPEATFQVQSFLEFPMPACRAVTALGEVFNYLFDPKNSLRTLRRVSQGVYDALTPKGLLAFDVAEPGRCKGLTQRFTEGEDWTCLVEYHHDAAKQRLTRRIVSFRKVGDAYRRHEESHTQQLYPGTRIAEMLRDIGFRVRQVRCYGHYALAPGVVAFVARKP
jgi:SAM-dependent methyltransferase